VFFDALKAACNGQLVYVFWFQGFAVGFAGESGAQFCISDLTWRNRIATFTIIRCISVSRYFTLGTLWTFMSFGLHCIVFYGRCLCPITLALSVSQIQCFTSQWHIYIQRV